MTMATNHRNGTENLSGTVEATNDKGIKVGGQWFNYSQFGPEQQRPSVVRRSS